MAADNFSKWLGGLNFVWARQWGSGVSNSNDAKKKYGLATMRKMKKGRPRFNPNVTSCAHPSCLVAAQSKRDKEKFIKRNNP